MADTFIEYVMELCACKRHGGRMVHMRDGRVALLDSDSWTEEMSSCVKARFPGCGISVHCSEQSVTGFQVVFEMAERGGGAGRCDCLYFLFMLIGVLVFWHSMLGRSFWITSTP